MYHNRISSPIRCEKRKLALYGGFITNLPPGKVIKARKKTPHIKETISDGASSRGGGKDGVMVKNRGGGRRVGEGRG